MLKLAHYRLRSKKHYKVNACKANICGRTGIALCPLKADPIETNPYVEERIMAPPQMKRLISVLTELVPGFEERLRHAETEGKREL